MIQTAAIPRRGFLLLGLGAALAACGSSASTSSPSGAARKAGSVRVLYAGSLVNLMEKGLGPAFQAESGSAYEGQGAGSTALAAAIKDKTKSGDVFVSADTAVNASLMGANNGDWVSWWILFARTSMVLGYSPRSRFAGDFEKAGSGPLPWYQVLQEPGIRLGRTDPALDPKGYRTFFTLELAQDYYHLPGLRQKILGADDNPDQIFPEETLESRLEAGALDAGFFYLNEAVERSLPYITLPDEINLSSPALAGQYSRATWTNPKGQTVKGAPILYTASVLNQARYPATAAAFVAFLLSDSGQRILKAHGLLPAPALYGGDKTKIPASIAGKLQGEYSAS